MKQEEAQSDILSRRFRAASENFAQRQVSALSLRLDSDASTIESRDEEAAKAFCELELARFDLVHHYNDSEWRKSLHVVEALCSVLYSYKAHFSECADIMSGLLPAMVSVQSQIADDRRTQSISDTIWRRRRSKLEDGLQRQASSTIAREPTSSAHFQVEPLGMGEEGAPVLKMGYLYKKSAGMTLTQWKKRWFVLQGGVLYYIHSFQTPNPTLVCQVILSHVHRLEGAGERR